MNGSTPIGFTRKMMRMFFAHDAGARTLQLAGMLRFVLIFIQGVVLVKAGVPLEIIGQIELVFFVANFMMFYWQNGGRNALLSWVPGGAPDGVDDRKLGAVFLVMQGYGFLAALLLCGGMWLPFMDRYAVLRADYNWLFLGIYVLLTIPAVPVIYAYLMRGQRRKILLYIAGTYALQILAIVVPVLIFAEISTAIRALALFAFLRWLFVIVDGKWFRRGIPSLALVSGFFLFAVPLVLHALNSGLMDYVDGWIVSVYFGDEQFALYRFGAKEFPVNALLIGGLLTGLIPKFRNGRDVRAAELKGEIRRLLNILFPINCVLLLTSPLLFTLVYNAEFVLSARIFNIYALTLLSRILINQVYLYVFHHNWALSVSTAAEILVNVALSIAFMQWIGLLGIPLATVVAFALHKVFLIVYIEKKMRVRTGSYLPWRRFALYAALLCGCFFLAEMIYF